MKLINNIVELENYLFDARKEGKTIGTHDGCVA